MTANNSTSASVRIGWVISGDRKKASSRLQGYLIHEEFVKNGATSSIIDVEFSKCTGVGTRKFLKAAAKLVTGRFTHLILEAPEWTAVQLGMIARSIGIIVVCVRCDRYPFSYDTYFDLTIVPTDTLRQELSISRAAVIPDMIEVSPDHKKLKYELDSRTCSVCWVGHSSYSEFIFEQIKAIEKSLTRSGDFEFTTISNGPQFTKQWSEASVTSDILQCDVAIIPIPDGDWFKSKSSNRLAMMLSLGMPTIASPLASYLEIGQHGKNVLFATTPADFAENLEELRNSHELRQRIGIEARNSINGKLTPAEVASVWMNVIQSAQAECETPRKWQRAVLMRIPRLLAYRAKPSDSQQPISLAKPNARQRPDDA